MGVRTTTRSGQDKLAEIQNIVQETISGNRIVKAFSMELWEMTRFREGRRPVAAREYALGGGAIHQFAADGSSWAWWRLHCCCLLGRNEMVHAGDTAGTFITFLAAVIMLYDPVRKLPVYYNSFQQAIGASDEIFRFMDAQDDVQEKKRAIALKGFSDSIRFENVGFSYDNDGEIRQVLHGINLVVPQGEVIAFVGPSGAGKSTLVNLIPRFFDVAEGRITIDGHDLRDVTIASAAASRSARSPRRRCSSTIRCEITSRMGSRMCRWRRWKRRPRWRWRMTSS